MIYRTDHLLACLTVQEGKVKNCESPKSESVLYHLHGSTGFHSVSYALASGRLVIL